MDSPKQCDLCGSLNLTDLGYGGTPGTVICHGCGGKWWKVWRTRKQWDEWINEDAKGGAPMTPKKGVDSPRIIRLFPRRTNATPDDPLAVVNRPPELFDEADEVHISVAFTWDLPRAEKLAASWRCVAPVTIGGPATGERGGDFIPGRYVKPGYVITSRGCPNRCWFCSVWKREGDAIRELPIAEGFNVLDDNLLACSDNHIRAVFAMLAQQPRRNPPQFTGGLEAKRLLPWHAEALRALRPKQVFFAYDTPDDLEPLREAGRMMLAAGFTTTSHALRCYVLCGWAKDTTEAASRRMREAMDAGFTPMAMAYHDKRGRVSREWKVFQRQWARTAIIHAKNGVDSPPADVLASGASVGEGRRREPNE